MRIDLFDELAPVCPRCLHFSQAHSPLKIGDRLEMRAGHLWQGLLHCSDQSCWMEYPVIDGVPILTPDPPDFLTRAQHQILRRDDLSVPLQGAMGDALGQASEFDRDRQHLSLYAGSHFPDWAGGTASPLLAILDRALSAAPPGDGPALDLGCSVGRGTWQMAGTGRAVLGVDLNFSMLRLAQRLMVEGRASFPQRRIGLVYDQTEIQLPADAAKARVDFWAADCLVLPFADGRFAGAGAVNLVDCIAAPTNMLVEAARILADGAAAFFTTPYDWAETATEKAAWMGGHSDRGPFGGAAEPVLTATLQQTGFDITSEETDLPWTLRMHSRSVMQYQLHLVACRRMPRS